MWTILKALVLRWILAGSLGRLLVVLLGVLLPAAGVLKIIGIPVLVVLLVLGAPLLLLLAAVGLPLLIVVGIGGTIIAALFALLSLSVVVIKVALPFILLFWLVRWVWRSMRGPKHPAPPPPATPRPDDTI